MVRILNAANQAHNHRQGPMRVKLIEDLPMATSAELYQRS
jgi:hypothetical protein